MRLSVIVVVLIVGSGFTIAGNDHIITEGYSTLPNLYLDDTLVMTGGGGYSLDLYDESSARIEGTSTLGQGTGGIWELLLAGQSNLELLGGGIHEFTIGSYARATFRGGRVDEIWSHQAAWKYDGDPPEVVADPHITIVSKPDYVLSYTDEMVTGVSGSWLDGSGFDITLVNVDGYSPVIENIHFIPEPATLLLLAGGAALVRKRRRV